MSAAAPAARIEDFAAFRGRLLEDALLWSAIAATPGTALSVARALYIGWKPVLGLHFAMLGLLWAVWWFRGRLAYRTKAVALLALTIAALHSGLAQFGPATSAQGFAIIMAFTAMLFLNPRSAWLLVAANTCGLALLGYAATRHWLHYDFDFQVYAHHPLTWLNVVWTQGSYGTILAYIAWRMVEELLSRQKIAETLLERQQEGLREIEAAKRRYRDMLESSPDWIWEADAHGVYTFASAKVRDLLGYEPEEIVGRTLFDLKPPDEARRIAGFFAGFAAECRPFHGLENVNIHKDGREVVLETSGVSVLDRDGTLLGYRGVDRDVTERRRVERELHLAKEAAEEASRAKTAFLASMSHELRTPLNAVIGFAQLLEMGVPGAPGAAQKEAVGHILGAGRHLLALVDEVLDLARIETGRLDLAMRSLRLATLVDEVVALTRPAAGKRGIDIRSACDGACHVHADLGRLRQVLLNLLSNAVKYNREGGRVELSCEAAGGNRVRIVVADTGPGIAPERRGELFQPFQRLGAERSNIEGTGIGLVVCKRLVEAMGGQIGLDGEAGAGSRFWFELPLAVPEAREALAGISGTVRETAGGAPAGRVLYIEDSPANVSVMRHVFRLLPGVELTTVPDGETALARLAESLPDLVLLEINLPGMSGLEVLAAMKAQARTAAIPVVSVSAAAMPDDIDAGLAAGFMAYVTKPFDVPQLLVLIDTVLRGGSQGEGRQAAPASATPGG